MAVVLLPVFLRTEQGFPAGTQIVVLFLMPGNFFLKEPGEKRVPGIVDEVEFHREFIAAGDEAAQGFMHPGGKDFLPCRGDAVVFFFQFRADRFAVAGNEPLFFHTPQFRINLTVVGGPEIAHFTFEEFFQVVTGQFFVIQQAENDIF